MDTDIWADVGVGIVGLCPRCRSWFACDDWFDNSVPLPCCPQCRLAPVRVEYRTPAAGTHSRVDLVSTEVWLG